MQKKIIELKDITFSYDNARPLFKNFTFLLYENEKVGLKGKTGAGKTTLLYLIMGFLKPKSGEIILFNKPRKKEEEFAEIRPKIGLLFQDPEIQLFCPTIKEDIAFGPLNLGIKREEVLEIIKDVSEFLGISHLLERSVLQLSGGEKKLCALATVMAMKPLVYLLDEPTTGLDEVYKEKLYKFLKERAKTYLIVSHDEEFLNKTCEKIYYLEEGKLKLWKVS
ncbi:MAG: energy-coupling factor ABC transporter ATP-binding protein [Caldimicrobium sp.]